MKSFFRIEKGGEESGEEVLTIQLIENLQRQEIEVIDRAKAGGGTAKEPEPPPGKKKRIV